MAIYLKHSQVSPCPTYCAWKAYLLFVKNFNILPVILLINLVYLFRLCFKIYIDIILCSINIFFTHRAKLNPESKWRPSVSSLSTVQSTWSYSWFSCVHVYKPSEYRWKHIPHCREFMDDGESLCHCFTNALL